MAGADTFALRRAALQSDAVRRPIVLGTTLAAAAVLAGLAVASLRLYSHPAELTEFGYVTSVTPKGSAYTAQVRPGALARGARPPSAAVEAGVKPAAVPNDYYIVNRITSCSRTSCLQPPT